LFLFLFVHAVLCIPLAYLTPYGLISIVLYPNYDILVLK